MDRLKERRVAILGHEKHISSPIDKHVERTATASGSRSTPKLGLFGNSKRYTGPLERGIEENLPEGLMGIVLVFLNEPFSGDCVVNVAFDV